MFFLRYSAILYACVDVISSFYFTLGEACCKARGLFDMPYEELRPRSRSPAGEGHHLSGIHVHSRHGLCPGLHASHLRATALYGEIPRLLRCRQMDTEHAVYPGLRESRLPVRRKIQQSWLISRLIAWFCNAVVDLSIDRLNNGPVDWLIDWLIGCIMVH